MGIPMASALGSSFCSNLPGMPMGTPMASALGSSFCSKVQGILMGIAMASALGSSFCSLGGLVAKHYSLFLVVHPR